jgi:uncharacterized protein DUF4249
MKKIVWLILLIEAVACKQKYVSPYRSPVTGYLVVEGVVNSGPGNTTIKLSRTTSLSNIDTLAYETGALVKLEGEDNSLYIFSENSSGRYNANNLNLNNSSKYRIHIITANSEEYISDYAGVNNNPPIDSVSWLLDSSALQLFVNTHDPQNNTHYYQWEYAATWEYHSSDLTNLKWVIKSGDATTVTYRDSTDPAIFKCWQSDSSQTLIIGSSEKLSQDLIYLQPLTSIPRASWELSVLYSIDVKQYGLTSDAYKFLGEMKKNTEETGSIFDAQPSQFNSNIHCVSDPSKTVIGFITICPVQEKRIYISNNEVPNWGYNSGCYEITINNQSDSIKKYWVGRLPSLPVETGPGNSVITFTISPAACIDCTLRGTNVKPSFWP